MFSVCVTPLYYNFIQVFIFNFCFSQDTIASALVLSSTKRSLHQEVMSPSPRFIHLRRQFSATILGFGNLRSCHPRNQNGVHQNNCEHIYPEQIDQRNRVVANNIAPSHLKPSEIESFVNERLINIELVDSKVPRDVIQRHDVGRRRSPAFQDARYITRILFMRPRLILSRRNGDLGSAWRCAISNAPRRQRMRREQ